MYNKSNKLHNFQYIVTFYEDEIDLNGGESKFGKFDFDWYKQVIAEYSDTEQKTIFKRFFLATKYHIIYIANFLT